MEFHPKTQVDGYLTVIGGQDSGRSPTLLKEGQAAELWNVTRRGGYPTNRPGFFQHPFDFPNEEMAEWFETHVVQGAKVYKYSDGRALQVWSVGGRIFSVDILKGGVVLELTPSSTTATSVNFVIPAVGANVAITVTSIEGIEVGLPLDISGAIYTVVSVAGLTVTATSVTGVPTTVVAFPVVVKFLDINSGSIGRVAMLQAEQYLIIQDGQSRAIIFDGSKAYRTNTAQLGIPVGTVMAYGKGRLWVGFRRRFYASDIVGGSSGTAQNDFKDAILKFTENSFLAGGGSFTVPDWAGDITAMEFVAVFDTSTGQGPLNVFTEEAAFSVDAPVDRTLWGAINDPIQTVTFRGSGPTSAMATVPTINGDIFFRSSDGIRSLVLAVRQFGEWANVPLSTEMDNVLPSDTASLLRFASAVVFDGRLLMTTKPVPDSGAAYHKGIVALDFHTISSMGNSSPPVYDGVWTGIDPWILFSGKYSKKDRAFAAVLNADGRNELWEISRNNQFDNEDGRITSTVVSRSFYFASPMEMKRLENAEAWVAKVKGDVDFTLEYRADEYPCWQDWNSAEACANWRKCVPDACETVKDFRPGYKTRIAFGQPPDIDELNDNKPARDGYEFQTRLTWVGKAEIKKFKLKAITLTEDAYPALQ